MVIICPIHHLKTETDRTKLIGRDKLTNEANEVHGGATLHGAERAKPLYSDAG